jgi:hypothetical protein
MDLRYVDYWLLVWSVGWLLSFSARCELTFFYFISSQVGNKRLKVQHKQIRQKDMLDHDHDAQGGYGIPPGDGSYQRPPQFPSGHVDSASGENLWYDDSQAPESSQVEGVPGEGGPMPDEGTDQTGTSNEAGPPPDSLSPLDNMGTMQNALPDVTGSSQPE